MRTQQEILTKFREHSGPLDFTRDVLFEHLDYDHAREFLKPECTREKYESYAAQQPPLEEARLYMDEYGWPKCLGERGISAVRTVQKMQAWFWLVGNDEMVAAIRGESYDDYGWSILHMICTQMSWPIPEEA